MTPNGGPLFPKLAYAAVSHDLPGSLLEPPDAAVPDNVWERLLVRLTTDRLTGQLLAAVDEKYFPATPEQRERLFVRHIGAMSHALRMEQTLCGLVEGAQDLGIEVVVVKGAAEGRLDYPSTSRRGLGDLDLLVRPTDVNGMQRFLEEQGFSRLEAPADARFDERFGKSSTYVNERRVEIDLHRTFVMGPYGLMVDLEELWSLPKDSYRLASTTMTALPREARLLHTCFVSVLGDHPPRLTPRRDIAELALFGQVEPSTVIGMAESWGVQAVLATALVETWDAFALVDETVLIAWAREHQVTKRDARLLALYRREDAPYSALALRSIPVVKGARNRAAFVKALAIPNKEFLHQRGTTLPRYLLRGAGRALSGGGR